MKYWNRINFEDKDEKMAKKFSFFAIGREIDQRLGFVILNAANRFRDHGFIHILKLERRQ